MPLESELRGTISRGKLGSVLQPFSSPACLRQLDIEEELERNLATARGQLVDLIAETLSGFSPEMRRFLLQARRDVFNGRSRRKHKNRPEWGTLLQISGGLSERILDLEELVAEARRTFAAVYERELERERRHLFVTRAAAKLSPYSTLTAMALGTVSRDLDGATFRFTGGPTRDALTVGPMPYGSLLILLFATSPYYLCPLIFRSMALGRRGFRASARQSGPGGQFDKAFSSLSFSHSS